MRPTTGDDYLERLNRVRDHVYANLAGDLSVETLARVGAFSPFHFHRVFRALAGETVGDFVQRVRLQHALYLRTHAPRLAIKAVAARCGFSSPAVFSRAFRARFDASPTAIDPRTAQKRKKRKAPAVATPEHLRTLPAARTNATFAVRVENLPIQHYAYIRVFNPYANPAAIMSAYARVRVWLEKHTVPPARLKLIGLSGDDPDITPGEECRYDAGYLLPARGARRGSGGVGVTTIAAGPHALATCQGDIHAVVAAWDFLFQVWLPRSGYEPADAPCFEIMHADPAERQYTHFNLECALPLRRSG